VFGLHPNADVAYRTKEASELLATLASTQPKTPAASDSGVTREEQVLAKATELLDKLPEEQGDDVVLSRVASMGGMMVPLNIFLRQEIQRLNSVVALVRSTLSSLRLAIHGEVAMTPQLEQVLQAIYDAKPPRSWMFAVSGDEISWQSGSLGLWFSGLMQRDEQLRSWIMRSRPVSFWMTGFFNPQGFLTAMRQEVCRAHAADRYALDDLVFFTTVTGMERVDQVRTPLAAGDGVFVHGLFIEGAAWSSVDSSLVEAPPKRLFAPMPILHVTAVSKATARGKSGDLGPYGGYDAPVYKYRQRGDHHLVFTATLPSREHRAQHWTLRGVSLLCNTE
jgi:dynein heavy chain